ncbi:DNA translocase FtsK [Flavobacterium sp. NRK F10]|uniref:Cell division protein FtsK n=1 Tax=Flavobacterium sediminis TaxID=2201181 RepID=A0A2U8QWV4_9FLAO|nr:MULTISPECIES: DNA translocase FtsK [Flavobacterium]AWM14687.1 cell division protein FtsK [Flavobacterium sediminis]MCO6175932.1 DNA translocase FtsK [Flavobacterium sp. NRK F10]
MAKKEKQNKKNSVPLKEKISWQPTKQQKFAIGVLLILLAVALLLSFVSYFVTGNYDQSQVNDVLNRAVKVNNWLGKFGAFLSDFFLYKGFGVASFIFVRMLSLTGVYLILDLSVTKLKKIFFWDLYLIIVLSILFGFFWDLLPQLSGVVGFEMNLFIQDYIGKVGTLLSLVFGVVIFLVFRIKISVENVKNFFEKPAKVLQEEAELAASEASPTSTFENEYSVEDTSIPVENGKNEDDFVLREDEEELSKIELKPTSSFEINKEELKPTISNASELSLNAKPNTENNSQSLNIQTPESSKEEENTTESDFVIEKYEEEESVTENLAAKLVQDFGEFDPTLELSNYQLPPIDLLKEYSTGGITIDQNELEENKNRIVETLRNYNIGISQIKATVGPTVTLYEIVPEAGIRISKIKNLEDDIALSLSALGIRIIAPIPGKGTIGIEVPNNKPTMVAMKSVIASPKFQQAEMELPIALGKNISNETFVVDLAKMPHLLMAGATGQGKSVGLNAILTSLLYKKHPAEVKFVLVDPKKVELTLFNKIERHYLAKLPDTEEAIITDNTKVINTLNSLCIEMDNRYNLLKDAMVRNIKEYNEKFKLRKLNPENGHRFLPYIVLVVDEFADLIMTAGKEVETPIARLAQLARAIGIHLIIATQRPSVNVITGIIKANFPARIAFRVTSKIDSRTILDNQGADQLIGRGDLLYTQGNDLTRVQCAFVDTPEVEKICDFIGNQKAYPDAYLLPEYVGEESGTSLDIDISERDSLFREAAEVIVTAQQGSASLIQRKLKLGYNRAGRIIDQLEAAGIVGPFEGSKARSVLVPDLVALDEFLNNEQNHN